jgi:hypothetical protein
MNRQLSIGPERIAKRRLEKIQGFPMFSQWVCIFSILLAAMLCVSQRAFRESYIGGGIRHLPTVLFVMGLAFQVASERLFGRKEFRVDLPQVGLSAFAVLAVWSILGSTFAMVVEDVDHHYLTFGVGIALVPLLFWWTHRSLGPLASENVLISAWGLVFASAMLALIFAPATHEVLHELEFLVFPFFLFLWLRFRASVLRLSVLVALVMTAYMTHKWTGYITAGLAVLYVLALGLVDSNRVRRGIGVAKLFGSIGGLLLVVAACVFMYSTRDSMPSGNTSVRLHQYAIALEEIGKAPVFGQFYAGESGILYREYLETKLIPTHSDLIDVLRQGGALAFAIFCIGYGSIVAVLLRAALKKNLTSPIVHATLYLSLSALATIAVNPILLKPMFAMTLWAFLALGSAVAASRFQDEKGWVRSNAAR